jgi:RNA polymerase sigma-70 factor (ECF subfamily)
MVSFQPFRPSVTPNLVAAVNRSAVDAFERLFNAEYSRVVGIAYRILADPQAAEDVAQDVFLKFHRQQSPEAAYAQGWLHAAAAHAALNVLRGDRRRAKREATVWKENAMLTAPKDPQRLAEDAEQRREVRQALARLPERSATILAMRYSGLSYAEIAVALRTRVTNIGTMLRRAEDALRKEVTRVPS